jgi:RNA polymerase sigma-70 factor (ECF subfamily)
VKIILTDETEPVMATGSANAGRSPDSELWERLRQGDRLALGELFDRYADDVHAFAFRRTASWNTAEDVVQTTFLNTWRRFQRNPPGPLTAPSARGWLLVVAGNECRTLARTAARFRNLIDRLPDPAHGPDHAAEVARRLDDERRMSAIRRAIAKLPRHERETLELVVWAGLSLAEAAASVADTGTTPRVQQHEEFRAFDAAGNQVPLQY